MGWARYRGGGAWTDLWRAGKRVIWCWNKIRNRGMCGQFAQLTWRQGPCMSCRGGCRRMNSLMKIIHRLCSRRLIRYSSSSRRYTRSSIHRYRRCRHISSCHSTKCFGCRVGALWRAGGRAGGLESGLFHSHSRRGCRISRITSRIRGVVNCSLISQSPSCARFPLWFGFGNHISSKGGRVGRTSRWAPKSREKTRGVLSHSAPAQVRTSVAVVLRPESA